MAYSYQSFLPKRPTLGRVASTVFGGGQYRGPYPLPPGGFIEPNTWFNNYQAANPAPIFAANPSGASFAPPATPPASAAGSAAAMPSYTPPAAPPGIGGVDYSQDPILARAKAQVEAENRAAEAEALAAQKQNFVRYGDVGVAEKTLGKQLDADTRRAIGENAFSTTAELGRWNQRGLSAIDSARNAQNLFYSSTRARDRALQEEDLIRQQASTGNQLQDVLVAIAQNLLGRKREGAQTIANASEAAYGRALQRAMQQQQLLFEQQNAAAQMALAQQQMAWQQKMAEDAAGAAAAQTGGYGGGTTTATTTTATPRAPTYGPRRVNRAIGY